MTLSISLQTDTKDDTLMMTIKVILILKQNTLCCPGCMLVSMIIELSKMKIPILFKVMEKNQLWPDDIAD